MSKPSPGAEFSHVVAIDRIGPDGIGVFIEADEDARAVLADRFRVPAVLSVQAKVRLRPDPEIQGQYLLDGRITADVEQSCVVTLEPVRQRIDEAICRRFALDTGLRRESHAEDDEAEWLDPEADDPPDPIAGGEIDVGGVVAEELALALDPYPRIPGANVPERYRPVEEEVVKVSPFAALARLKSEKKD